MDTVEWKTITKSEDTNEVIRNCKSENKQYNSEKKNKTKGNNDDSEKHDTITMCSMYMFIVFA